MTITDKDKQFVCLYGIFLFCKQFGKDSIHFQTESSGAAELFPQLVKSVFSGEINLEKDEAKRGSGVLYSFVIKGEDDVKAVKELYRIKDEKEISLLNIVNNSINAFMAGVFISCGSIIDPLKEYHLEFNVPTKLLCDDLSKILMSLGFGMKTVLRKNLYVIYSKDSEEIEDMMTFMGAQQSTLELMNIKILKDVRNKANRIANCDTANIDKVINASTKQLNDIHCIEENMGINKLSADLREIAEIRLENPELSLREIGEMLSKPLQRSGVNHRFRKISMIADELRNKKEV